MIDGGAEFGWGAREIYRVEKVESVLSLRKARAAFPFELSPPHKWQATQNHAQNKAKRKAAGDASRATNYNIYAADP